MLLLHGGPGMTHEYLEPFSDYIKKHPEVEIIYYDQLCSYFSDQPDDPTLLNIPRFIDEIEEVRKAWHLEQFYLYLNLIAFYKGAGKPAALSLCTKRRDAR